MGEFVCNLDDANEVCKMIAEKEVEEDVEKEVKEGQNEEVLGRSEGAEVVGVSGVRQEGLTVGNCGGDISGRPGHHASQESKKLISSPMRTTEKIINEKNNEAEKGQGEKRSESFKNRCSALPLFSLFPLLSFANVALAMTDQNGRFSYQRNKLSEILDSEIKNKIMSYFTEENKELSLHEDNVPYRLQYCTYFNIAGSTYMGNRSVLRYVRPLQFERTSKFRFYLLVALV